MSTVLIVEYNPFAGGYTRKHAYILDGTEIEIDEAINAFLRGLRANFTVTKVHEYYDLSVHDAREHKS